MIIKYPSHFIRPVYDGHCFTAIPTSIAPLLTGQDRPALAPEFLRGLPATYEAVVVFLIDALGWRFIEKYADGYPALRRFVDAGRAFKLLAQFPSTTAAHVTCLHTGLESGQSGIFEWQYYEPQLDAVITPLLFSYAGTKERDQLKPTGVQPASLYPSRTLYQALADMGVTSYVFQHQEYTPSTYSDLVFAGARAIPYRTLPEALVNLRAVLAERDGPTYCVLYFDRIDAIGHEYGPSSPQFEAQLDALLTSLERLFLARLDGGGRILFLLTADHGQVEVDPATTLYLNTHPNLAPVVRYLRTDRQGRVLVPGGSPRDVFLYVRDEVLDEAQAFLAARLAGRAVVWRVSELIEAGYFGAQPPSPQFRARAGDLVILPYPGEAVWWYEKDRFEQKFYGHHGGLTPQEMEIPLLVGCF